MLENLIDNYGYLALFIGVLLEGEVVLVLGGFMAREGEFSLPWVIATAYSAALASDHLFFFLGRIYGQKLLERFPVAWQQRVAQIQKWLKRVDLPLILGFRFLYGFRAMTPFVFGMGSMRARKFSLLEGTGACIWAVSVSTGGYLFGTVLEKILGNVKRYEKDILFAVIALAIGLWIFHVIRNRKKLKPNG